jgi:hypothetical protein
VSRSPVVILIVLAFVSSVRAQAPAAVPAEATSGPTRSALNAVLLEGLGSYYSSLGLQFERTLLSWAGGPVGVRAGAGAQVTAGGFSFGSGFGNFRYNARATLAHQYGSLPAHNLEYGLGAELAYYGETPNQPGFFGSPRPVFNLGYRYAPLEGGLTIRAGVNAWFYFPWGLIPIPSPELYGSVGFAF